MKSQKGLLGLFVIVSTLNIQSANAAGWVMPANPGGLVEDFMGAIGSITTWLLGLAATLAVLAIIYGGIVYTASSGDQKRIEDAKKTVKYAIMGLIMAGIAYAVVNVIITNVITEGGPVAA